MNRAEARWFKRPQLKRTSPARNAANFFRSAADGGKAIGGIRLDSAEAAVVAAVRTAYRVAEAQIDRSARLARRLREAGDRSTGGRSDRQALDATEQLIFKAIMALLGWVEGAASERGNPLQRLATAQYRIVGSVLGLTPPEAPAAQTGSTPEFASRRANAPAPAQGASGTGERPRFPVQVILKGTERRVVRVSAWEYSGATGPKEIPVEFYHAEHGAETALQGKIVATGSQSVRLTLTTTRSAPPGRWSAALCDRQDVQVGYIEIVL